MPQDTDEKSEIIKTFRRHEDDTGSPEVQVALLTDRIDDLTEHMQRHPQDNDTRRGLFKLVSQRNSLLQYLRENDEERYSELVEQLNLNG